MRKVSAILLAALLLLVNMSLTFSTHYCGGEAVETSISLGKADVGCGMEVTSTDDCDSPTDGVISKNCCSNEHYTLSIDEDYKENTAQEISAFKTIVAAPVEVNSNFFIAPKSSNRFVAYPPPLVKRDITVMHQVFRL